MSQLQDRRFRATIQMADGRRIEIEERLPVQTIVTDAKRVGAAKVELENGTEIYLNERGDH